MKTAILCIYLLLLLWVLIMIYIKTKNRQKVHRAWYWALGALILLPVLYFFTIGSFSVTQTEGLGKVPVD